MIRHNILGEVFWGRGLGEWFEAPRGIVLGLGECFGAGECFEAPTPAYR